MKSKVDQIPLENKWAMATKGLTGALAVHLNAIYDALGEEKYSEIIHDIWAQLGKETAEQVKLSGVTVENAKSLGEIGATTCICSMGPEYTIEQIEASEDRTVMKITECPWKNRMNELEISHDLLSACDVAFWDNFTKSLNPDITMKHGKQMHRGDAYCEWIFETKK